MQYLLLGLAALVIGLLIAETARGAAAGIWVRRLRIMIGILVLAAAAGLFVRGAAGPATLLAMFGLWLINATGSGVLGLPGGSKTPGQSSSIVTEYLEADLDHDTGEVTGRVIKGTFAGRTIETLTGSELIDLWQLCQGDDPASAQVVEAILNSVYPDWRDWGGAEWNTGSDDASRDPGRGQNGASGEAPMSRDHAYEILGLKAGATPAEIRAAHRDLMQKIHPDHGGSTYLAAQINQAKDVLLS